MSWLSMWTNGMKEGFVEARLAITSNKVGSPSFHEGTGFVLKTNGETWIILFLIGRTSLSVKDDIFVKPFCFLWPLCLVFVFLLTGLANSVWTSGHTHHLVDASSHCSRDTRRLPLLCITLSRTSRSGSIKNQPSWKIQPLICIVKIQAGSLFWFVQDD